MHGDELENMVALPVVSKTRELLNGTERTIAVVVALFQVGAIFELLLYREIKDLFAEFKLSSNVLLGKPKVRYIKES
jgi:hypothetical protein